MAERTLIRNLAALDDGTVTVSGWVDTVGDQKKVQFVVLRDESAALQLVHPPSGDEDVLAAPISDLAHGSCLTVTGQLKNDERVMLGCIEVLIDTLEVEAAAIPETPIADDT